MIRSARIGPPPVLTVDIAGEAADPARGELVLLLHGAGGRRSDWRVQLEELGAAGRLAVAWDARGYGDSDDYDGPLAMADFTADVLRVLDHFDAPRAHLVGLSMGGRIVLDVWNAHPEQVASLVLADTSAGHPSLRDPAEVERALELRLKPLLEGRSPGEMAPDMVRSLVGSDAAPAVAAQITASLAALHPESYVKTMRCMTREAEFAAFETISAPVLVINGSEDRIARVDVAEALAKTIPDHRFVRLERVGHLSNLEAPDRFNRALLEFLDRVDAADSALIADADG